MKYLPIILIFTLSSFSEKTEKLVCLNIDIFLIADYSSSVQGEEMYMTNAIETFVERFELTYDGINIGIILFNDDALLISPLTSDVDSLLNKIQYMKTIQANGNTNMINPLTLSYNNFFKNQSRLSHNKLIIMMSDGFPDNKDDVLLFADVLKNSSIDICSIAVDYPSVDEDFMTKLSSNNCYVVTNFENLIKEIKKLEICL